MWNKCKRCGHKWYSYTANPKRCRKCYSEQWRVPHNIGCEICTRTLESPEMHHVDGNHENNKKLNQIFICSQCHRFIHNGRGKINMGKSKRRIYSKDIEKILNNYRRIWMIFKLSKDLE